MCGSLCCTRPAEGSRVRCEKLSFFLVSNSCSDVYAVLFIPSLYWYSQCSNLNISGHTEFYSEIRRGERLSTVYLWFWLLMWICEYVLRNRRTEVNIWMNFTTLSKRSQHAVCWILCNHEFDLLVAWMNECCSQPFGICCGRLFFDLII